MKTLTVLTISLFFTIGLSAQSISKGKWSSDSFFIKLEGTWKIIKEGDKTMLVIQDDFETKEAPDLKIYLSKLDLNKIDADNAVDKNSSVYIAHLTKYEGSSKFEIPSGIDLKSYKTILIHCVEYDKFWGGSSLW